MLERAEAIYGGFREGRLSTRSPGAEALLVQLFMAFGQMRYEPAIPLLRRYVPRNFDLGERARAAAIWALGLIFEDQVQQDLVAQFSKRLDDIYGMEPEFEAVRRMSAISMGRMNAESALPMLRKHAGTEGGAAGLACLWAIEQITGEPMPELDDPPPLDYRDWFLMPLDRDTSP
jgi:HEAT repeat protein